MHGCAPGAPISRPGGPGGPWVGPGGSLGVPGWDLGGLVSLSETCGVSGGVWRISEWEMSVVDDKHAKMLKNVQICSILWVFGGFRGCRISKK